MKGHQFKIPLPYEVSNAAFDGLTAIWEASRMLIDGPTQTGQTYLLIISPRGRLTRIVEGFSA